MLQTIRRLLAAGVFEVAGQRATLCVALASMQLYYVNFFIDKKVDVIQLHTAYYWYVRVYESLQRHENASQ